MLIKLIDISLSFGEKVCFGDFSAIIYAGDRIALIGENGAGKTQLLKALAGEVPLSAGKIIRKEALSIGYVPQTVEEYPNLSGGERFNRALSKALEDSPDLLILDEPTNHLDSHNRRSLLRMLKNYAGAIIFATHDEDLLRELPKTLWHIYNAQIRVFPGSYNDYTVILEREANTRGAEIVRLKTDRKKAHESLMKEQRRRKKSRQAGEKAIKNHKMPPIAAGLMKMAAENAAGKKSAELSEKRNYLKELSEQLYLPQEAKPKFLLPSNFNVSETVLHIVGGEAGYNGKATVSGVNIILRAAEKAVIQGANGSGKSTLAKAILDRTLRVGGEWHTPNAHTSNAIGYLDQHYANLEQEKTVFETVRAVSDLPDAELRSHLNDFIFRSNSDVHCKIKDISGGEKARLSLAVIALSPKKLLILDEITNNIDLKTKKYMANILRDYPAALILISHERSFIEDVCGKEPLEYWIDAHK
jgi:ATPase subunit of ABC transporter with duplicated ATPase domains